MAKVSGIAPTDAKENAWTGAWKSSEMHSLRISWGRDSVLQWWILEMVFEMQEDNSGHVHLEFRGVNKRRVKTTGEDA